MLSQQPTLTNYRVKLTLKIINLKSSMSWLREAKRARKLKRRQWRRRRMRQAGEEEEEEEAAVVEVIGVIEMEKTQKETEVIETRRVKTTVQKVLDAVEEVGAVVVINKISKREREKKLRQDSVVEGVVVVIVAEEVVVGVAVEDVVVEKESLLRLKLKPQMKNPRLERKRKLNLSQLLLLRVNPLLLRNLRRTSKLMNLSSQSRRKSQQLRLLKTKISKSEMIKLLKFAQIGLAR